jgi:hypothetical protein
MLHVDLDEIVERCRVGDQPERQLQAEVGREVDPGAGSA